MNKGAFIFFVNNRYAIFTSGAAIHERTPLLGRLRVLSSLRGYVIGSCSSLGVIVKVAVVIEATSGPAGLGPSIEHAMNNHSFIFVRYICLISKRQT